MDKNLAVLFALSSAYVMSACSSQPIVTNNVNTLTSEQQQQVLAERAGQLRQTHVRFNALDINEDGYISLEKFNRSGDRSFMRRDTNNDGVLSAADPAPARRSTDTRTAETKAADLAKAKKQPAAPRPARLINMPTTHNMAGLLGLYDANNDQQVSKAEYDAARLNQFNLMDSNGDGRISYDEYIQDFAQRLDQHIALIGIQTNDAD